LCHPQSAGVSSATPSSNETTRDGAAIKATPVAASSKAVTISRFLVNRFGRGR
jgi:hypothetical protein